ncbi:MAG: hypothetical protein PHR30_15105 [Gallionellaceae bacterium]|nr:hypothetical protein [Gallionellaceae bacterium]
MFRKTLPFVVAMALTAEAHAFGINDVLSIGIQAGGKLLGAAVDSGIDKARDAMRDPAAEAAKKREEERKLAEQFQKQAAEIESMPDLRPIDRERLVLQLEMQYAMATQFQSFVEVAEARQREERDKIFTTAGLVNVIGEAAMSTPSAAMVQAELLAHSPSFQANQRMAMAQAGLAATAASPLAASAITVARTAAVRAETHEAVQATVSQANAMLQNSGQQADVVATMDQAKATAMATPTIKRPPDAFTSDLGRKLFVEFVGSPTETARLRELLTSRGHTLTDQAGSADVRYRIEGEYSIYETVQHGGLTKDVGDLLERPAQDIAMPEKKRKSSLTAGLGRLLLGMAAVPSVEAPASGSIKQVVLIVASRHPMDSKETRVPAVRAEDSANILGASLSVSARDALYEKLGFNTEDKIASVANAKP